MNSNACAVFCCVTVTVKAYIYYIPLGAFNVLQKIKRTSRLLLGQFAKIILMAEEVATTTKNKTVISDCSIISGNFITITFYCQS